MSEETAKVFAKGYHAGWEACRELYFNPEINEILKKIESTDEILIKTKRERRKMIDKIQKFIDEETKEEQGEGVIASEKQFGYILMKDGRKAQVSVKLEMDEDEWIPED